MITKTIKGMSIQNLQNKTPGYVFRKKNTQAGIHRTWNNENDFLEIQ